MVDLATNRVSFGIHNIRVAPRIAEVLSYIVDKYPRKVLSADLLYAVWTEAEFPHPGNVQVQICLARRALRPMGYTISSHVKRGYSLERVA